MDEKGTPLKKLVASLLLCICLITQATASNRYYDNSDWRDLPFVEMMAAMMRAMNNMLGINDDHYFPGMYSFPYSPAFFPGTGLNNPMTGFTNFPMSSTGFGNLPGSNYINKVPENFQTGQNARNNMTNNFWDPNSKTLKSSSVNKTSARNNSLNGIWQALSGDVIAIYKDNYFIWSDGSSRNLSGRLLIKGNILYAYIPASKTTLQFEFYFEPGQFIVRDKSTRIYTFKRLH